jgi:DNA-binding response OmpR family regulator
MAEILIIDDDPQMRRVVAQILKGAGHTPHEAANGKEGIAVFQRQRPALVISDIVMPDMEGIETILTLRREAPTIPILAISGRRDPNYLRFATTLGASAALDKPFGAEELLATVEKLLNSQTTEPGC